MRTCHATLRYFDWDGQVHLAKGKTGGQQGDPLEMLIFNLTIHNLWGRVLAKFQETWVFTYVDDGYMKGRLSVVLQVLAEPKCVLKEVSGLELNVGKTSILPNTTQQTVFDVTHSIIVASPALTQLRGDVFLVSFCPEGFVCIGVYIGTDAFIQNFVTKTCRSIIDDVEKLDSVQDGFIHYQLLRFCQTTRLQYTNSHILLRNRCVLHQWHVDCKIAGTLLKKSSKQHTDGWDTATKVWAHMVLHLSHAEGGFGVTFNDVTQDASFYTSTSRFVDWIGAFSQERQGLWLTKDDLQDPSSWSSSPLLLLRGIQSKLLTEYDYKEGFAPSQSQAHAGVSGRLSSQDGDAQQQEDAPLFLPQFNKVHEASIVWGEDASNVATIPDQNRLTHQILSTWQHFKDLKQTLKRSLKCCHVVSRRVEQLCQRVISAW